MRKLIALTALLATSTMPALASQRDQTADQDRPAHAREARNERHSVACSKRPASEWMPLTEVTAKLLKQGFTILKIETKTGCYEARVTDEKGTVLELYLDAVTAEIVRRRERG